MSAFERAIDRVFNLEGGFSHHPADRGGATRYGITEAVARAHGYTGRMEDLPELTARQIAKSQYWDVLRLDEIARMSYPVALELFDSGFNCGAGVAAKFLQRALNGLNRGGQDYPDLDADGAIGPMTLHSLHTFLNKRGIDGQAVLLKALNALQGAYYLEIARTRRENESFVYGWLKNRVDISGEGETL